MSFIVVDKSWLQSLSDINVLKEIALKHRIVVTDILLYEISTTFDKSKKLSCFNKLLKLHNALEFLPNTGYIIRKEMRLPVVQHELEHKLYPRDLYPSFYEGLSKLADKNAKSGNIYNALYYNHFENKDVAFLKKIGSCISNYFPEIRRLKSGENKDTINKIIKAIGCDEGIVKSFYKNIYRISDVVHGINMFPPVELLSKKWALFRHVQVYLIAAIIYVGKYGDGNILIQSKKFGHDSVDYEYIISGALANGIATKDKLVKEIFTVCCPDGIIYS
ncbi:MAG: hypothetical protein FJ264_16945 [Planctomycetes bacterium]|nr:hypothetical protein [Planctomycetota bacterium]